MNERDAFIRVICERPDDDTPRLVFADWRRIPSSYATES
jgi:hypothetical protein